MTAMVRPIALGTVLPDAAALGLAIPGAAAMRSDHPPLIRLRRDGQPPLRFIGRTIGHHDGRTSVAVLWHDVALYRCADGDYAVAIMACGAAGPIRCHATRTDTLDAALARLETHDPGADLCPGLTAPPLWPDDPALSPTALALQAARLRCALEDVTRRYRIGVGHFLMTLAWTAL